MLTNKEISQGRISVEGLCNAICVPSLDLDDTNKINASLEFLKLLFRSMYMDNLSQKCIKMYGKHVVIWSKIHILYYCGTIQKRNSYEK